jgi:hypothetical protein
MKVVLLLLILVFAVCVEAAPPIAQNGDRRGLDNDRDGYRESTHVRNYTRSNGTHVRGHYRAGKQDIIQRNLFDSQVRQHGRRLASPAGVGTSRHPHLPTERAVPPVEPAPTSAYGTFQNYNTGR